jgi:hypothetical protein
MRLQERRNPALGLALLRGGNSASSMTMVVPMGGLQAGPMTVADL